MNLAQELPEQQQEPKHSIFNCDLCKNEVSFAPAFQVDDMYFCLKCVKRIAFGYFEHIDKRYEANYYEEQFNSEMKYRSSLNPNRYKKKKIGQGTRMKVYERDGFKCVTCGTQQNLTLDHIKPEILGGESTIENLQTMCKACNSRKGARYVETPNQ
ncbi:HNH endonuclease [Acinetobacter baumannii]|uniref:HNH endonuclease n=1 Tax=Acinetobacter baumannii TaxID=470 RepID=UPI00044BAE3C|nr:HNH endonuclease [Acinetobacter baumannii]EXA64332.1 HNH endonuclease family protein [Acinetobacter baumannii 984213]